VLTLRSVATREEELEALSSEELRERAVKYARRHADVKFFWRLMQLLPAASAATGDLDESHDDIESVYGHFDDLHQSAKPEVADALRPLYVEYLVKHPKA
jgi:hypothetical protein